jgi:hypothetical protein
MLDQLIFAFDNTKSGHLYLYAGSYTPHTGWDQCETGRTNPFRRWRAFFNFDTSAIPDHAEITVVTFRIRRGFDPVGDPDTYALKFSLGTFIGAALNGNVGEWNGGTHLLTLSVKPTDKDVVDLSADGGDPLSLINKTGETDLKIWDDSAQGGGDTGWATVFNKTTTERCELYVTFSVPSGTAVGRATASCSATVTHAASATATGVGEAEMAAGLILASAAATVTGRGTSDLDATVTHNAGATVTGVGSSSARGHLILAGAAEVTGTGSAVLAAHLELHAAGTATGIGTATCAGKIDVYFPPLAIHEDTISVVAVDGASIAVASAHTATISAAGDTATVGRRRN